MSNSTKITKELCSEIKKDSEFLLKKELVIKYGISLGTIRKIIHNGFVFDDYGVVNENTTLLRKIPLELLSKIISNSFSYSEIIRNCGLDVRSSYITLLKKIIKNNNFDISHFNKSTNLPYIRSTVKGCNDEEIFIENSKADASTVKKRIIKKSLIKYECNMCGIINTYNNKPLKLQLDHINGNNKDNRLLNLRFLCPNCHSQTDTFTGKNVLKKVRYCVDCGNVINKKSIRCVNCSHSVNRIRKFEVTKDELEKLLKEHSKVSIGKMFGVSDNAIKKRCIVLGINQ